MCIICIQFGKIDADGVLGMLWKSSDDEDDGNDDIELVVNELLLGRLASDDVVICVDGDGDDKAVDIGDIVVAAAATVTTVVFVGAMVVAGDSYLLPGNKAAYEGGGSKSS